MAGLPRRAEARFDDDEAKVEIPGQVLGRPIPPAVTSYPPFYTGHGLNLDLQGRAFINQGCTFLDYAASESVTERWSGLVPHSSR